MIVVPFLHKSWAEFKDAKTVTCLVNGEKGLFSASRKRRASVVMLQNDIVMTDKEKKSEMQHLIPVSNCILVALNVYRLRTTFTLLKRSSSVANRLHDRREGWIHL